MMVQLILPQRLLLNGVFRTRRERIAIFLQVQLNQKISSKSFFQDGACKVKTVPKAILKKQVQ